jgi:tetratricopeptide (TPR) repeat protein
MMYPEVRRIWIASIYLLVFSLCFCSPSSSQVSPEQLRKLRDFAPELKKSLEKYGILPKAEKGSHQLAEEVDSMIRDELLIKADKSAKNMESLDLNALIQQKYGTARDIALLFAAFLQTCDVPTSVVVDKEKCLLLFKADPGASHTVVRARSQWQVIAVPIDAEASFEDALRQGKEHYNQLEKNRDLRVISIDLNWNPEKRGKLIELIGEGIGEGLQYKLVEARKSFLGAMEIEPENPAVLNNIGNLHILKENVSEADLDEAIEKYKQALRQDPDDPAIHLNLFVAYYEKWKLTGDKEQKQNLKQMYQDAFGKAYQDIISGLSICRRLGVNPRDESYREYSKLIYDTERQLSGKEPDWRPYAGRGKEQKVPVYWKIF